MTRRRDLLSLVVLNAVGASQAQPKPPSTPKRKLDVLWGDRQEAQVDALAQALRTALAEFGWIAGQNLTIEWHFANGDRARLSALAEEIVRSTPDAILTYFVPPTRALQIATTTIPIVTSVGDPIGFGFARSYALPGGNITGLSFGLVELQHKTIELLRSAVPLATRLIFALNAHRASDAREITRAAMSAAGKFGFVAETALLATAADLQATVRTDRTSAMIAIGLSSPTSHIRIEEVIAFSLNQRVPTVVDNSESVELGGLMSYEFYWDNQTLRTAAQLDKILRGVSPAQIPFEQPTRSWFAVNLKTARALGLVLPHVLLARADQVIECRRVGLRSSRSERAQYRNGRPMRWKNRSWDLKGAFWGHVVAQPRTELIPNLDAGVGISVRERAKRINVLRPTRPNCHRISRYGRHRFVGQLYVELK